MFFFSLNNVSLIEKPLICNEDNVNDMNSDDNGSELNFVHSANFKDFLKKQDFTDKLIISNETGLPLLDFSKLVSSV
jgi:hypothetical protein